MSIRKGKTIIAGSASSLDWTGTLEEYNIALENGIIQPDWICYITDDTLYTDDIRPEIETLNSVKANKDLSNLSEVGEKHFLNKSQITNCITEIPQRIKYTLEDGVLTILAGSVAIVPYGTEDLTAEYPVGSKFIYDDLRVYHTQFEDGKFFVWVEILEDKQHPIGYTTGYRHVCLVDNVSEGSNDCIVGGWGTASCFTSTTNPTQDKPVVYNPDTNRIYNLRDGAVIVRELVSFPLMTGNYTQNYGYNNIDKVFNGMGYFGSTVWIDKGVKGLIPNGRNEDGSLKNIEWESQKLYTTTRTETNQANVSGEVGYNYDTDTIGLFGFYYEVEDDGYIRSVNSGAIVRLFTLGTWEASNGGTTFKSYKPNQPFIAFDENKKYIASGWGMPSSKYIDLTLGATATTYFAPANGFYFLQGTGTSSYSLINLERKGNIYGTKVSLVNGEEGKILFPVKKGDEVYLGYANINNVKFRFIYAEGEI